MNKLNKEFQKIDRSNNIRYQTMEKEVEKFLNRGTNFSTIQQMIRIDKIFRGVMVRDWFRVNENNNQYK